MHEKIDVSNVIDIPKEAIRLPVLSVHEIEKNIAYGSHFRVTRSTGRRAQRLLRRRSGASLVISERQHELIA